MKTEGTSHPKCSQASIHGAGKTLLLVSTSLANTKGWILVCCSFKNLSGVRNLNSKEIKYK